MFDGKLATHVELWWERADLCGRALWCCVQCIEAYMDKMVECLVFLCECNELTLEEKAQFLKKVGSHFHMGPRWTPHSQWIVYGVPRLGFAYLSG